MIFFKYIYLGIKSITLFVVKVIKCFFIGLFTIVTILPRYFISGITYIFGKKEKKKEKKKPSFVILGLSFAVYLVCVFLVSKWYVQELKVKYLSNDIVNSTEIIEKEDNNADNDNTNIPDNEVPSDNNNVYYPNDYWDYMNVSFMDVNFDELINKNSDTVGWIKVEGTKVNYPVVQTDDNEYYLNHAFNGRSNIGGWVFADYRDDFVNFGKNTIIYGHNMNNKTMFGSVPSMLYNGYLYNSNNYYIKISTPYSNSNWKVFSVYTVSPEIYYLKTNFRSDPFSNFIDTIKNRSVYDFGIDVSEDDKILTLSTCDNTGTKRVAVHAKMVSIEYK